MKNPQSALEIRGTSNYNKIKFGATTSTGGVYCANRLYTTAPVRFLSTFNTSTGNEIGSFWKIDNYDDPVNATQYFSISTDGTSIIGSLNIGSTITLSTTYKCNIDGSVNATSYYNNNNLIDFNSYATNTNLNSISTLIGCI